MKRLSDKAVLTEGPVGPTLLRLTIPMVFGILGMVAYNLADTYFVGRLGKDQLAALSFTFPVVLVISSIAQGLGMGASAAVSRAIGKGDRHRVQRLATDALLLALVIVGFFAVIGMLTIRPLFSLLGARGAVLDHISEYMRIWYFGMIFVIVPMVGNSTIRATGDSRTPGLIMIAGALINTGLDPLLIFGPGVFPALGISGAALATLIGRSSTFCVALFVLIRRERLITFEKPLFREMTASWGEILYIGLPNAGTKMIVPLGVGAVTRILAGSGMAAVAGYGIGSRLEFFSLAAVNALSTIFGPFIGQNIGAGKLGRVSEGFRKAELFSFALGGSFFLIYLFSGRIIASVFSDDPEVVSTAALYIRVVAAAYGLQGFYMITASGLNVLKRPFHAAGLSLLEMFGLIIPLGLLGSVLYGVSGVFIAIAVSYAITGLVSRRVLTGVLAAA